MVRRKVLAAAAALTVLLVACGGARSGGVEGSSPTSSEPTASETVNVEFPLTFTDAIGKTHTFEQPISRIGCPWDGCTEALADLGIVPQACWGYGKSDFYYPNGTCVFQVNKMDGDPDSLETWAQTDTEVLIARGPQQKYFDALEPAGELIYLYDPSYFAPANPDAPTGIEAYYENLRVIAAIIGHPEAAEEAIARHETILQNLQSVAPDGAVGSSFAAVFSSNDGIYSITSSESPFCDALQQASLGTCASTSERDNDSWEINAEAFLGLDPDWIGYMFGEDGAKTSWEDRDDLVWGKLNAVRNGQAYNSPAGNLYCCSLRAVDYSLLEYANNVWPEAGVPDPGPIAEFDTVSTPLAEEGWTP